MSNNRAVTFHFVIKLLYLDDMQRTARIHCLLPKANNIPRRDLSSRSQRNIVEAAWRESLLFAVLSLCCDKLLAQRTVVNDLDARRAQFRFSLNASCVFEEEAPPVLDKLTSENANSTPNAKEIETIVQGRQMKQKSLAAALPLALMSMLALSDAQAALLTNYGQVISLRVEGTLAFVGMAQTVSPCGNRYWIDMNSAGGKSAYATAMMAFMTDANVYIRADDNPATQQFGECVLHDIFVAK